MSESVEPTQPRENHWKKLAETLGIASETESAAEQAATLGLVSSASEEPGVAAERASEKQGQGEECSARSSTGLASPDAIPLKRAWKPQPLPSGNWDAIASQLGLAPPPGDASSREVGSPSAARSTSPPRIATSEEGKEGTPTVAAASLSLVEQTVTPPALAEASSVAVAVPEETHEVTQADVSPVANWLEEQVVAAMEEKPALENLLPVSHEVFEAVARKEAIAADTVRLEPIPLREGEENVGSVPEEEATRGRSGKKRRRRRGKSQASPRVSPEPFEEELPEIVELAAEEAETDLGLEESAERDAPERDRASHSRRDRRTTGNAGKATVDKDSDEEEEDTEEGSEESEIPRPAHKAIPGWAEVVGHVIQKNMEARARRSGPNHRERRR